MTLEDTTWAATSDTTVTIAYSVTTVSTLTTVTTVTNVTNIPIKPEDDSR